MSRWTHVEGHMKDVKGDLSNEPTPEGSEGGSGLSELRGFPGYWVWDADLRDRDEEDAPEIRDWFTDLCSRADPTEAELRIDTGSARYDFTWDAETRALALSVPALYGEGGIPVPTIDRINALAQEIVAALPAASNNPEGWDYFVAVRDVLIDGLFSKDA